MFLPRLDYIHTYCICSFLQLIFEILLKKETYPSSVMNESNTLYNMHTKTQFKVDEFPCNHKSHNMPFIIKLLMCFRWWMNSVQDGQYTNQPSIILKYIEKGHSTSDLEYIRLLTPSIGVLARVTYWSIQSWHHQFWRCQSSTMIWWFKFLKQLIYCFYYSQSIVVCLEQLWAPLSKL